MELDTPTLAGIALAVAIASILAIVLLRPKPATNSAAQNARSSGGLSDGGAKEAEDAKAYPGGKLVVFFGSQTGTAEGFAQRIAEESKAKGFDAFVVDLEDFEPEMLTNGDADNRVVSMFMMATYGEGEPTDSASEFVRFLKNVDGTLDQGLSHVSFSVFGLGNTQYEHFNKMGKHVDAVLEKFGAVRFHAIGLGDDDGSIEDDFDGWKEEALKALVSKFHPDGATGNGMASAALPAAAPDLPVDLKFVKATTRPTKLPANQIHSSSRYLFTAEEVKVIVNRELRAPSDGGSTRHVELSIRGTPVTYVTADNLAVLAENDQTSVEALATAMGYDLEASFVLEGHQADYKHPFPTPCTVRQALSRFCDIHGIPRRSLMKDIAPFATSPPERETLLKMASKEGKQLFREFVEDKQHSLLELLVDAFPSVKVPLVHFLALAPRLQPRYYTISSSSQLHPDRIHITVSVTKEMKADGRVHNGVCSTFLQSLPAAEDRQRSQKGAVVGTCRVFVRESSFRLPKDPKTPIIMIGPGTGIAPMRALLQERQCMKANGENVGESILYFGCRQRSKDFIYEAELQEFEKSGILSQFHVAFSREGSEKVYVQHLMQRDEDVQTLWRLISDKSAHVYVCGGTSMGHAVGDALQNVVMKAGKKSTEDAHALLEDMKRTGKYVQELWA